MRPEYGIPAGWSFNPSRRDHRRATASVACIGLVMAAYMAGFQLHLWDHAWDPFFKDGTERVLTSRISRAFPVPDALLGAIAYLVEIILLVSGDDERWRTRPFLTLLSGAMSLALGAASIGLMILQPVVVHAWCTECLVAVAALLIVLQRSVPETTAVALNWLGVGPEAEAPISPRADWMGGVSLAGNLLICVPLGVFTLAMPGLFGIEGVARFSIVLAGALTVGASVIAMAEVARSLRLVIGFAGFLLFSYFLGEPFGADRWLAATIGAALMGLCPFRRRIHHRYGALRPF